jgi:hypothetical protein
VIRDPVTMPTCTCPEEGATKEYHSEFKFPTVQHPGVVGSPVPVAQVLSSKTTVPNVMGVAPQGRSLGIEAPGADMLMSYV